VCVWCVQVCVCMMCVYDVCLVYGMCVVCMCVCAVVCGSV